MDYDRNDALLHWLFRQTQGDAWFRPNEENISSGVALRVSDGMSSPLQLVLFFSTISIVPAFPEFRVFPYENANLEPFETAVAALNPVVAVKVRSAAVHAALAEVYVIIVLLLYIFPVCSTSHTPHHGRFLLLCSVKNCFRWSLSNRLPYGVTPS